MGERGFYTRRPPVALAPASAGAFSGVNRWSGRPRRRSS